MITATDKSKNTGLQWMMTHSLGLGEPYRRIHWNAYRKQTVGKECDFRRLVKDILSKTDRFGNRLTLKEMKI